MLEAFYQLKPKHILSAWIQDVIEQEAKVQELFSEEEIQKEYQKDKNNCSKLTALFRQGVVATLSLQFIHL